MSLTGEIGCPSCGGDASSCMGTSAALARNDALLAVYFVDGLSVCDFCVPASAGGV